MKEIRTVTILAKADHYIHFLQTERIASNGTTIKTYEIMERTEKYGKNIAYRRVTKEEGNLEYKEYKQKGYKLNDKYSFEPTQMDMR